MIDSYSLDGHTHKTPSLEPHPSRHSRYCQLAAVGMGAVMWHYLATARFIEVETGCGFLVDFEALRPKALASREPRGKVSV